MREEVKILVLFAILHFIGLFFKLSDSIYVYINIVFVSGLLFWIIYMFTIIKTYDNNNFRKLLFIFGIIFFIVELFVLFYYAPFVLYKDIGESIVGVFKEFKFNIDINIDIKKCRIDFPIWYLFPPFYTTLIWWIFLTITYYLNYYILYFSMKYLNIENYKENTEKYVFKTYYYNYVAYIFAAVFFGLSLSVSDSDIAAFYPACNIYTLLETTLSVFSGAFWIAIFNYIFTFRNSTLTKKQRFLISLLLGILTAPYIFYIPNPYVIHTHLRYWR